VTRVITLVLALAVVLGTPGAARAPLGQHPTHTLDWRMNPVAVVGDSYTTGGDEGGLGTNGWTTHAWQSLLQRGLPLTFDVAAQRGSGYGARGDHGDSFEDLTARAVKPDDVLVVLYGSRNDQAANPILLPAMMYSTFQLARKSAPRARFLVIGPPWPTADPPPAVLRIRDTLAYQAQLTDAAFVDPIALGWFVGQPGLIGADGVHPNDAGHAYMADKIAPFIAAQLR